MLRIWQYAIILHPTKDEKDSGKGKSEIIKDVTSVLAKDEKHANIIAARAIPENLLQDLDRIEVAVKPF